MVFVSLASSLFWSLQRVRPVSGAASIAGSSAHDLGYGGEEEKGSKGTKRM